MSSRENEIAYKKVVAKCLNEIIKIGKLSPTAVEKLRMRAVVAHSVGKLFEDLGPFLRDKSQ